jgi:hypothetical protein
VLGAVLVQGSGSGLAGDKHAGAGVPGLVAEHDAGIEPAFGGPRQVDGGRPQPPDPLRIVSEPFGEAQA